MNNVVISMEATCDIPQDIVKKYDFKIIDMPYLIGENEHSAITESFEETKLYQSMRSGEKTSTSQINENQYFEHFKSILDKENKIILHLAFSSGLSNTYKNAVNSAEKINIESKEKKVFVIDSLCACSGQGLLAILVAEFLPQAKNIEEVINFIEDIKLKVNHLFTVEKLDYLVRGGRVSSCKGFIGNILNIKPVMYLDDNGKISSLQKVFGRKKSLATLVDIMMTKIDLAKNKIILVSHADCEEDALCLSNMIYQKTNIRCMIVDFGAIIGCHSGPGTISTFFIGKSR